MPEHEPVGNKVEEGGWNGLYYDTPTTAGHRMYNAGWTAAMGYIHDVVTGQIKPKE